MEFISYQFLYFMVLIISFKNIRCRSNIMVDKSFNVNINYHYTPQLPSFN